MAFIGTTPPETARGTVREMYERQQARYGYVPNYAKVFCHRPEVMARWASLLAGIRSPIEPRRFELVTLAAAQALRNSYCSLAHGSALAELVAPAEVEAIATGIEPTPLSDAEVEMMRFARKVAVDASRVTAGDVARLQAHGFADEEIFDIAATAAARAFFAKLLDALGVEPDAVYRELPESLRKPLTVGRPIEFRPTARVEPVAGACVPPVGTVARLDAVG